MLTCICSLCISLESYVCTFGGMFTVTYMYIFLFSMIYSQKAELISVAKNLKVQSRGTGAQELRSNLKAKLRGIQQLPALLSTGQTKDDVGCGKYEICKCEPMHDLKNVISPILDEIERLAVSDLLKKAIADLRDALASK